MIRWEELTVFWIAGLRFALFSQNVAVSKSSHRLLFHPIGKEKSIEKKSFFEILSTGVDYRKGRC